MGRGHRARPQSALRRRLRARPDGRSAYSPFFLTLVDSLGVRQVLRFRRIDYEGAQPADGARGASAPERFTLVATWERDTVTLRVRVAHALATDMSRRLLPPDVPPDARRLQPARTRWAARAVQDEGQGFFETYLTR